jgi:hypothetical protein
MIEVHAEFLLEINLKILLRKTGAKLNLKIDLNLCILTLDYEFKRQQVWVRL